MKFEMQLKMQTLQSSDTDDNDWGKIAIFEQKCTFAADIKGRSRQFVGFIWFRTFESPIREKTRDTDITTRGFVGRNDVTT